MRLKSNWLVSKLTNESMRNYVEQSLNKDIKQAMNLLVEHINQTGELERYYKSVILVNNQKKIEARREEKERKKIEMGSAYDLSEDEEPETSELSDTTSVEESQS